MRINVLVGIGFAFAAVGLGLLKALGNARPVIDREDYNEEERLRLLVAGARRHGPEVPISDLAPIF